MKRYSHAQTIAYEVDSDSAEGPTLEEALEGLEARVRSLREDPAEAEEALLSEAPYDTYDRED